MNGVQNGGVPACPNCGGIDQVASVPDVFCAGGDRAGPRRAGRRPDRETLPLRHDVGGRLGGVPAGDSRGHVRREEPPLGARQRGGRGQGVQQLLGILSDPSLTCAILCRLPPNAGPRSLARMGAPTSLIQCTVEPGACPIGPRLGQRLRPEAASCARLDRGWSARDALVRAGCPRPVACRFLCMANRRADGIVSGARHDVSRAGFDESSGGGIRGWGDAYGDVHRPLGRRRGDR